jgi:hypothetical protein
MSVSNVKAHWEKVYTTKATDQVSRYRPHLEISLSLIERAAAHQFEADRSDRGTCCWRVGSNCPRVSLSR